MSEREINEENTLKIATIEWLGKKSRYRKDQAFAAI